MKYVNIILRDIKNVTICIAYIKAVYFQLSVKGLKGVENFVYFNKIIAFCLLANIITKICFKFILNLKKSLIFSNSYTILKIFY